MPLEAVTKILGKIAFFAATGVEVGQATVSTFLTSKLERKLTI